MDCLFGVLDIKTQDLQNSVSLQDKKMIIKNKTYIDWYDENMSSLFETASTKCAASG